MKRKKKQKEFWTFEGEELCNIRGIATLASQMNGGKRPSETTIRNWLKNGLQYKSYISRQYAFRVSTVKQFLLELDKPAKTDNYSREW